MILKFSSPQPMTSSVPLKNTNTSMYHLRKSCDLPNLSMPSISLWVLSWVSFAYVGGRQSRDWSQSILVKAKSNSTLRKPGTYFFLSV